MQPPLHRPRDRRASPQEAATMPPTRAFEWRRCPKHPWFGVSVLVVGPLAACVPPDESPMHPVELEQAA